MIYANFGDYQNRITRRPYWNYANYRDYQNRFNYLCEDYQNRIIEITKIDLTGGHIGIIIIIEIAKTDLTGGHI